MPKFWTTFARKITKFPNFTWHLPDNGRTLRDIWPTIPEFFMTFAQKIFSLNLGGEGHMPPSPAPTPRPLESNNWMTWTSDMTSVPVWVMSYLPVDDSSVLPSCIHVMLGVGWPDATHGRIDVSVSLTMWIRSESSIVGGTASEPHQFTGDTNTYDAHRMISNHSLSLYTAYSTRPWRMQKSSIVF